MNRKLMLIAIALFLAATTVSAQVSFTAAPASAGLQWTDTATYSTTINTTAAQTSAPPSQRDVNRSKSCVVQSVDNAGRIDAVRVSYSSSSFPAVNGKTYYVTPGGVSYVNGGTPPAAEAAFVRGDNASFGQFRAIERIFGGKSFNIGQSFTPNRQDAEELLNVNNGTRLRSIAMTLRSVTGGVARFDVSMTIESDPREKKNDSLANGIVTMTLGGTLDVAVATSRPVLLDVGGNIGGSTKNKKDGRTAGTVTGNTAINIAYEF